MFLTFKNIIKYNDLQKVAMPVPLMQEFVSYIGRERLPYFNKSTKDFIEQNMSKYRHTGNDLYLLQGYVIEEYVSGILQNIPYYVSFFNRYLPPNLKLRIKSHSYLKNISNVLNTIDVNYEWLANKEYEKLINFLYLHSIYRGKYSFKIDFTNEEDKKNFINNIRNKVNEALPNDKININWSDDYVRGNDYLIIEPKFSDLFQDITWNCAYSGWDIGHLYHVIEQDFKKEKEDKKVNVWNIINISSNKVLNKLLIIKNIIEDYKNTIFSSLKFSNITDKICYEVVPSPKRSIKLSYSSEIQEIDKHLKKKNLFAGVKFSDYHRVFDSDMEIEASLKTSVRKKIIDWSKLRLVFKEDKHHNLEYIEAIYNGKVIGYLYFEIFKHNVFILSAKVNIEYRNQGLGKFMQEALVSYLNGKFGIGNYSVSTDVISPEGYAIAKERSRLMFNPEKNKINWSEIEEAVDLDEDYDINFVVKYLKKHGIPVDNTGGYITVPINYIDEANALIKKLLRKKSDTSRLLFTDITKVSSPKFSDVRDIKPHPSVEEAFKDSVVRYEDGSLKPVFHGTPFIFQEFNPRKTREIGFHFGPVEQANAILKKRDEWANKPHAVKFIKNIPVYYDDSNYTNKIEYAANIHPVFLNIKNPLYLPDIGFWGVGNIMDELEKRKILKYISKYENKDKINKYVDKYGNTFYYPKNNYELKLLLKKLGYDGIAYKNKYERGTTGKRDWTYIPFSIDQIQPAFLPLKGKSNIKDLLTFSSNKQINLSDIRIIHTTRKNYDQWLSEYYISEYIEAHYKNERIGYIKFYIIKDNKVIVEYSYVKKDYRNQGIGKKLQEAFIAYLNGKFGIGNYTIHTQVTSPGGYKMFEERERLMFNPEQQTIDWSPIAKEINIDKNININVLLNFLKNNNIPAKIYNNKLIVPKHYKDKAKELINKLNSVSSIKFSNILNSLPKRLHKPLINLLHALYCVESLLPLYESVFPNDETVKNVIRSVYKWLNNPTEDNYSDAILQGELALDRSNEIYNSNTCYAIANAAGYLGTSILDYGDTRRVDQSLRYATIANENLDYDGLKLKAERTAFQFLTPKLLKIYNNIGKFANILNVIPKELPNDRLVDILTAVYCAEKIIPAYEKERPNDKSLRSAINLVKQWIKNPESVKYGQLINTATLTYRLADSDLMEINNPAKAVSYAVEAAGVASVKLKTKLDYEIDTKISLSIGYSREFANYNKLYSFNVSELRNKAKDDLLYMNKLSNINEFCFMKNKIYGRLERPSKVMQGNEAETIIRNGVQESSYLITIGDSFVIVPDSKLYNKMLEFIDSHLLPDTKKYIIYKYNNLDNYLLNCYLFLNSIDRRNNILTFGVYNPIHKNQLMELRLLFDEIKDLVKVDSYDVGYTSPVAQPIREQLDYPNFRKENHNIYDLQLFKFSNILQLFKLDTILNNSHIKYSEIFNSFFSYEPLENLPNEPSKYKIRQKIDAGVTGIKIKFDPIFNSINIIYHETPIIKFYPNKLELNTGGWYTKHTKEMMNRFLNFAGIPLKVIRRYHRYERPPFNIGTSYENKMKLHKEYNKLHSALYVESSDGKYYKMDDEPMEATYEGIVLNRIPWEGKLKVSSFDFDFSNLSNNYFDIDEFFRYAKKNQIWSYVRNGEGKFQGQDVRRFVRITELDEYNGFVYGVFGYNLEDVVVEDSISVGTPRKDNWRNIKFEQLYKNV